MERGHDARGIHLENRADAAAATKRGRSIKVSVARLDQPGGGIRSIVSRKRMEQRESARGGYLENRAIAHRRGGRIEARAALDRRSVEASVAPLDPFAELGTRSIASRKGMKRGQDAGGSYLENRAEAVRAAGRRRPVEVSVAALNQSGQGAHPVAPRKRIKRRHHARGIHLENCACPDRTALAGRSIEVSVTPLDQPVGIRRIRMELMKHLILLTLRGRSKKRYPEDKRSKQIPAFHNWLKGEYERGLKRPD